MASIVIVVIVFALDSIAFSLAVIAELRNIIKIINGEGTSYCKYDKLASGLGVGAFFILLASQLIMTFACRCLCCGRGLRPGGSRAWAVTLFITSWVMFVVSEFCLFVGFTNAYSVEYSYCMAKGGFGAGAAFIVITGILSEVFYIKYSKSSSFAYNNPYQGDTGATMSNL